MSPTPRVFVIAYAIVAALLVAWTTFVATECVYEHVVGHPFWPVSS